MTNNHPSIPGKMRNLAPYQHTNQVLSLINKDIQGIRARLDEVVKDLHELTIRIGHAELSQMVSDLRSRLHDPFMFVIVGEVKSGKSSFINALLATGREITKVAPQPMTDTIQQIVYGEAEETVVINPYLKKIILPVEILREIAIVDTPGTNTIVEHHQEITERFIPASDLIVFVFEAKNPYRQSAWDFFEFIHGDWRKKVIFVLQQKDLMDHNDLAINIHGVQEQARKNGIEAPLVFAVSAKAEQEGKEEESGFLPLRDFIRKNITGGKAPLLKIQNNISTAQTVGERIDKGLGDRQQQWEADQVFRADVKTTLDAQEQKSHRQVDILVENLLAGYDRITNEKERELAEGLSFFSLLRRSISAIFSRKTGIKEWLGELASTLERQMHDELNLKLNANVDDLADSIQQMARLIDMKLRSSETILRNDHDIFSDIAERRGGVLRELQDAFSAFVSRTENFRDESLFPNKQSLAPNVATGSGLAAIGVIVMVVTQGMVFDITGGILTGIGLLFAGISSAVQRRRVLEGYRNEVAKGRTQIESEITQRLKSYISHLKTRIDANFRRFDEHLVHEGAQLKELKDVYSRITGQLEELEKEVG